MIARYVHEGKALDYRPSEAVAAGEVIVLESLVGIARLDIAPGTLGSLAVTGVFEIAKAAGEITAGVPLYWDAANKNVTVTAAGNTYIGKAVTSAASADAVVHLLLNAPYVATVTAE